VPPPVQPALLVQGVPSFDPPVQPVPKPLMEKQLLVIVSSCAPASGSELPKLVSAKP